MQTFAYLAAGLDREPQYLLNGEATDTPFLAGFAWTWINRILCPSLILRATNPIDPKLDYDLN
jgi:hypothetical protein